MGGGVQNGCRINPHQKAIKSDPDWRDSSGGDGSLSVLYYRYTPAAATDLNWIHCFFYVSKVKLVQPIIDINSTVNTGMSICTFKGGG